MKKQHLLLISAALLTAGAHVAAQSSDAKMYAGLTVGPNSWNVDCADTTSCKKNPTSFRVLGGYSLTSSVALELTYADLGKVRVNAPDGNNDLKGSTMDLSGVYKFGNTAGGLGAFVKGGPVYLSATGGGSKGNAWGVSLGGGVTYALTPNFALRAELNATNAKLRGEGALVSLRSLTVGGQMSF